MWTLWYSQQNQSVKARHAVAMRFLVAGHWAMPHYRPLQGKDFRGLGEIRVGGDVEWRLVGHRDTQHDAYTVVVICNHKGRVYQPTDALATAARRWREMQNGLVGVRLNVHPS